MTQKIKKLTIMFFAATSILTFASCNKDNENGNGNDIGTEIRLQENVAFINEEHGSLLIKNQMFCFSYSSGYTIRWTGEIANVGKVNGLSSIKEIPAANAWWLGFGVVKGDGYVVRWTYYLGSCIYYRIYVKDLITDSAGNFLGAVIRYDRWDLFDK